MLKHMLRGGGSSLDGNSWVATLGGSSYDDGQSVAVAPDGSVYVCGTTESAGDGSDNLLLVKFNSSGTVQWQKTLGGSSGDYGNSVAVAPDGSVYVCGVTVSTGAGYDDLLLAKFSSSGTVQWQKTLGGSKDDEYGRSVAVAPDGSVYVCGEIFSTDIILSKDFLLAKFSSSGTVQWQKRLDGINHDCGRSVAVAPDGSVYVCGYTNTTGDGSDNLLLVKFNSSGTVQWQKTLGGSSNDQGYSVAVAPDGSVYVCGETVPMADTGITDLLLAKFSSSGTVQWQKTLGGLAFDNGYSVAVAPDGSVYVCGVTESAGAGDRDVFFAKFSSSGTVQWQKTLGGIAFDIGYSVAVAPDGSVYVCGYTYSIDSGNYDLLLAKITDFLIEKDTVTFGSLTFQDASLTVNNTSLTIASSNLSVSNAGLTVTTPSLTVGTPSLTTNLYTL